MRELDALTGLAEYRNGGLFVDAGVLVPKRADRARSERTRSGSELVVEWRALTVALLDRARAAACAQSSGVDAAQHAARRRARGRHAGQPAVSSRSQLRADGGPPFACVSDGTVF